MLNSNTWNHLTVCKQMIYTMNSVQTNRWNLIELLIFGCNTWNHLSMQTNEFWLV